MEAVKDFSKIVIYAICLVLTIGALFLLKATGLSVPITVTSVAKPAATDFSVVGEGKVDVIPDTANISAGIVVSGVDSVEKAQSTMNTINNNILTGVKALGVKEEDIKTSQYSIQPNYSYENNVRKQLGYDGNATVTIKVRDTKIVGDVIAAATKAGANNVNNNGFTVENPETFREQARNKAIENAKAQAKKLSDTLGIKLGKITNMVEASGNMPYPVYTEKSLAPMGAGAAPRVDVEPGTQTITSTVTLYFEKL